MTARPVDPVGVGARGLRCPACKYDVSRTLADGIQVCPECGATVTYDLCRRRPLSSAPLVWLCGPGVAWAGLALLLLAGRTPFGPQVFALTWLLTAPVVFAGGMRLRRAGGEDGWGHGVLLAMALMVINTAVMIVTLVAAILVLAWTV